MLRTLFSGYDRNMRPNSSCECEIVSSSYHFDLLKFGWSHLIVQFEQFSFFSFSESPRVFKELRTPLRRLKTRTPLHFYVNHLVFGKGINFSDVVKRMLSFDS